MEVSQLQEVEWRGAREKGLWEMGKQWVKHVVHSQDITINNELDWGNKSAPFSPGKHIKWKSDPRRCVWLSEQRRITFVHVCPAAAPFTGTPGPSGKDCYHAALRPWLREAVPSTVVSSMDLRSQSRCLLSRQLHATSYSPCDGVQTPSTWIAFFNFFNLSLTIVVTSWWGQWGGIESQKTRG